MERERETELQLARLTQEVSSGFREVGRRMDVQDKTLGSIDEQARITNGRVTKHDYEIANIQKALASAATPAPAAAQKADDDAVTVERVKQFAQFGGWLIAGLMGLLKLTGKL